MRNFLKELKRRKVFKEAVAYLVVSWLLLQVFSIVLPNTGAPDWVLKAIMLLMAIGFPVWLFISWVYEVTPEGFKKTATVKENHASAITNKRLSILILVALITAIGLIIFKPNATIIKPNADGKYAIAVLPFKDMSSEDTQWFCDGVTDKILHHLSPLKKLIVTSRTSSDSYKETDKKIPEIVKELNVDYIIEGSVTMHNNKVQIIVQLINVNDGHIWSEEYKDSFDDIFSVQQNVSKEIAKKLMKTLNLEEETAIVSNLTDNKEAYQLFLKGRSLQDTKTKQSLESSIKLYQEAINLDSNYAEAYTEMAYSYYLMAPNHLKFDEVKDSITNLLNKSLNINPNIAKTYTVKGLLDQQYFLWESVAKNFKKAIELNPNDAIAHYNYAQYFWNGPIQDRENQLKYLRIANQLEPLSFSINHWLFISLIYNYKVIEAEELNNRSSFLIANKRVKILRLSRLNVFKNKDWTEAIKLFEAELQKDPNNIGFLSQLKYLYESVLVDREKALKMARLAYNLDSTSVNLTRELIWTLIINKKIKEAKKMLKKENIDDDTRNFNLWFVEMTSDNPNKIMDYHYKLKDPINKMLTFAKLGDINSVNELRTKHQIDSWSMAQVFAYLKERDSMYYYMNKIPRNIDALNLNNKLEFDPYRKEERYKTFLKKNYLPLTHWNE